MLFQIRSMGALLSGVLLVGNVAHAQFGDCAPQPDCAVAMPTCAMGDVSCETCYTPLKPRIRYQVPTGAPQIPKAPITYEVVGLDCAPAGCADISCEGLACESIGCDNLDCLGTNCDNAACFGDRCLGGSCFDKSRLGGSCLTGGHGCRGNGCVGGPGGVAASAVHLVGATTKEKYRQAARSWYYKSFDRHRHLNHPIDSPADHPTYGYYQTCWERFPEAGLWCPPCYGNSSAAADMYNAPTAYPDTTVPGLITPGESIVVPPVAPPVAPAAPPATPSVDEPTTPPADEQYEPPIVSPPDDLPAEPAAGPAAAISPTTSATMLYAPQRP